MLVSWEYHNQVRFMISKQGSAGKYEVNMSDARKKTGLSGAGDK